MYLKQRGWSLVLKKRGRSFVLKNREGGHFYLKQRRRSRVLVHTDRQTDR